MKKNFLRIIDANVNRAREGLRVCEEIVRFILEDAELTRQFKKIRHQISTAIQELPGDLAALLASRASQTDVGKDMALKGRRKSYQDVFLANIQRVKEALRVLEEFSKIYSALLSKKFTRLRFQVYALEKKTIARL